MLLLLLCLVDETLRRTNGHGQVDLLYEQVHRRAKLQGTRRSYDTSSEEESCLQASSYSKVRLAPPAAEAMAGFGMERGGMDREQ